MTVPEMQSRTGIKVSTHVHPGLNSLKVHLALTFEILNGLIANRTPTRKDVGNSWTGLRWI